MPRSGPIGREPLSNFFIQGKNFFLTYPQCHLSAESAGGSLMSIFPAEKILYLRVVKENHEDGTPHLHCLVCLNGRIKRTSARFADIGTYHGNYKLAYDVDGAMRYMDKAPIEEYVSGAIEDVPNRGIGGFHVYRHGALSTFLYQDHGDLPDNDID